MADNAAHLVDRVLPPIAGYRQWTLSFPRWLRIRLLRDPTLVSALLTAFVRSVFADHRRRARHLCGRGGLPARLAAGLTGSRHVPARTRGIRGVRPGLAWHSVCESQPGGFPHASP